MGFSVWLKSCAAVCLRKKPIGQLRQEAGNSELYRNLGVFDLINVGVGGIIGAGIFILSGTVAAQHAGPAVVISFLISGFASALAALCYAELSSMIPISGSAYSFAYATLGEVIAWIIGWDLMLEYLVGAAAVSVGWSAYLKSFFAAAFNVQFNRKWSSAPVIWDTDQQAFHATGAIMDLPAVAICLILTTVLTFGIRESARVNNVLVVLKVLVVLIFIFAMAKHVNPDNLSPFVPPNTGKWGEFGPSGVFQGATIVFFAYIGFDAVSTTAQECRNPQRDLPIGILCSLLISTVLYIAVCIVVTGIAPYSSLGVANPIAAAVEFYPGYKWLQIFISLGALMGLTSVILCSLLGQPRIFCTMAKDGLLPAVFGKIHPRFQTPYVTTIATGVLCALLGGILPIDVLAELTSVGTLFAFVLVCLGVCSLRRTHPNYERKFRVPCGPYLIPLSGALISFLLICMSTAHTIARLVIWMAIGMVIYYFYGRRYSALRNRPHDVDLMALPQMSVSVSREEDLMTDRERQSTSTSMAPGQTLTDPNAPPSDI